MPNRWETSARPLFVKTVFVNGNRHAILFEKDPLLRCGKKISRPNSSLSFASDLSISFSDSQESGSEGKSKPFATKGKDLSTELQSCLVKLKLASGSLDIENKANADKCMHHPKELKRSQSKEKGGSKQKRHKWNHEKICRRRQRDQICDEPSEHKLEGRKNSPDNSCYVYNLENYRGKKKYCFVKISSQPPQFILNCCCEKNWNESHNCKPPDKNNLVISATIHNLVMSSPEERENILHKTFDYIFPFQNAELDWNNYLTKSYYNSLSDRVFQWLDLARKRKQQQEKSNSIDDDESFNKNTERIFSGKTFVGEKNDFSYRQENRILTNKRTERITKNDTEEDVEGEVVPEPHVETLLSADKLTYQDCIAGNKPTAGRQTISEQQNTGSEENSSNKNVSPPIQIESPLKIQDLLLNFDVTNRTRRKTKEPRNSSPYKNKPADKESKDSHPVATIKSWQKRLSEEDVSLDKIDADTRCRYNRTLDECADKIKNPISTEEFAERNKKSINNLNITRAKPVLIQNLLSPQQPGKTCYFEEEKIVWGSEKTTGRPQLHIFMPSVLLKDQSDDSLSECESFLNL